LGRAKAACKALVGETLPQLVTLAGYLVAVGLRFPGWFVIISIAAIGAVGAIRSGRTG
jgi:hypothetical protein